MPKTDQLPVLSASCELSAQRVDCKEYINLVSCQDWKTQIRIALNTSDMEDLAWSPTGSCFVVWDTPLAYYLRIYSVTGQCLAAFSAYQDALGIKSISWAPGGQRIAIGSYDEVHCNWHCFKEGSELRLMCAWC